MIDQSTVKRRTKIGTRRNNREGGGKILNKKLAGKLDGPPPNPRYACVYIGQALNFLHKNLI